MIDTLNMRGCICDNVHESGFTASVRTEQGVDARFKRCGKVVQCEVGAIVFCDILNRQFHLNKNLKVYCEE